MSVMVAKTSEELAGADKIILPGVGAFDWAMERLNASGMRDTLDEMVKEKKRPVLGVCVGMQIMARRSEEGTLPGLGWIPGEVRRFGETPVTRENHLTQENRLPHMGWNDVTPQLKKSLFRNIESPTFYFLHSYYFLPDHSEHILGTTDYNGRFASAVEFENVFGTQFHPEKSHQSGVALLRNFAEL